MSPHRVTLTNIVKQHVWTRGAELGVDKGVLFEMLLSECPELHLIGVDVCPVPHRKARCESIAATYPDRAQLLVMRTTEAAQSIADRSLDFVFIDADHSDQAVTEDIACWLPKIKTGGWIGGHDYNRKFPGVVSAVDRAFGSRVRTYQPGSIWGLFP